MNEPKVRPTRCTNVVTWYGYDHRSRCRRPAGHEPGEHWDGLWCWDESGVRVDGTPHLYVPGAVSQKHGGRPRSLTGDQVLAIRDRAAAGETVAQIARRMQLAYHVVYVAATGRSYRDVA